MRLSFQQTGLFARDIDTLRALARDVRAKSSADTEADAQPTVLAAPKLQVKALPNSRAADQRWDAFAERTKATFQGSAAGLRLDAWKAGPTQRLRRFAFFDPDGTQIGQCAVLAGRRAFRVLDVVQLLPACADRWSEVMAALLATLGSGQYFLRSRWSEESSRAACVASIRGVRIDSIYPVILQGVNLSRWPDFERYWKKTSENVRRNARYALERHEGIHVERLGWRDVLPNLWALCRLKAASLNKKGLQEHAIVRGRRLLVAALTFRDRVDLQVARAPDGHILSFQLNVRFGSSTYYLEGGQDASSTGANWLLFREVLRDCYDRHPQGHFMMGMFDPAIHDEAIGGGLQRSRRSLRVDDHAIADVRFSYVAAADERRPS